MSSLHKIGDAYHKHVYRHYISLAGKVSDLSKFCLSDVLLGLSLIYEEMALLVGGLLAYGTIEIITSDEETSKKMLDVTSVYLRMGIGATSVIALLMASYFTNYLRTPLKRKIALEEHEPEPNTELQYCIDRLNELSVTKPLSFPEVNNEVNASLDTFIEKLEGYRVSHPKRIKSSLFSKQLQKRGAQGLMNPLFPEIVVISELFPEAIAHEKSHLVGYPLESDAEFIGYASMKTSGNPALQYLAYRHRLQMVLDRFGRVFVDENGAEFSELDGLRLMGLNERTLEELRALKTHFNSIEAKTTKYVGLKKHLEEKVRSFFLKHTGQGSIEKAYTEAPLGLISAFDPPLPHKPNT